MNPVAFARYLAGLSTTKLAKELKVSKQYISRLEQGIYDKPNKTVMDWATVELNKHYSQELTPVTVENLYRSWQWQQRESTKDSRNLKPVVITKYDRVSQAARNQSDSVIYYHQIFGQWVGSYWDSVHSFCVSMCLHPSPVAEYVEGRSLTMPNKLVEVLTRLELLGEGFKTNER
ncbi:helix-turn-helix domain-containing protein [Streptomyces anandii]|uniref:helix-turn-helix domain-containing protein n=1 Tax=Streptomyces anandii TaxID=285454 RepID=UPI0036CB132A